MIDGEAELIQKAIAGESSAFGALYDHYQPHIYRFVFLRVSHREDAEDITHQVFVQAWRQVGRYEDRGHPFSSWLYRIARNQVIDHYRTRKENVSLDDLHPDHFADVPETERMLDTALEVTKVAGALRRLPAHYQDVIIMRFVEELTVKEVAHILEKSEGAVKVAQHRALKELKKKLGFRIQDSGSGKK